MYRWIVPIIICISTGIAGSADVPSYSIKYHEIELNPEEKQYYKRQCSTYGKWMNVMIFEDFEARLPLAETDSCVNRANNKEMLNGMNPDELTVDWLAPGEMVWIRWSTFPHGSGSYKYEGHVVAIFIGEKTTIIFKTSFVSASCVGALDCLVQKGEILFNQTSSQLTLVQNTYDSKSSNEKIPLSARIESDNGHVTYVKEVRMKRIWTFILNLNQFTFNNGLEYAELGNKNYSIQEIADGFKIEKSKLIALNPQFERSEPWTGTILINDALDPYQESGLNPLYGDKGRPPWQ